MARSSSRTVAAPHEPWINAKVQLRPSQIHGIGMITAEAIREGERVAVFGGVYTNAASAERALAKGKLVIWMVDAFTLVARGQIAAGEELVADYVLWEADERFVARWSCRCGASICRTTVTGVDWRLPEIRRRYAGHFSPLLNKRILTAFPKVLRS